jgi:hypothetical protein
MLMNASLLHHINEVVSMVTVNDLTIADGKPDPHTSHVMQLFPDYTTAYG